jgi:hypothetical protein
VKAGANNILAALNALAVDLAFGVGNYRDFPRDPFPFQHQQNPTNVAGAVIGAINAWTDAGGGDLPEANLFALHKLAEPPGGTIGWRAGAKRIVVWFGDAPGHDPVCPTISGEGVAVTEASVTAELVAEGIVVLAISVSSPGLDGDPTVGADYTAACGPPGGTPGQGTRLAGATGGQFASGINAGNIVATIVSLVRGAVAGIRSLTLVPSGATTPFVDTIAPAAGFGPLPGDRPHEPRFEVLWRGIEPCADGDQVFTGALDVVADGAIVASKAVRITVPACPRRFVYSVKFVCGEQRDCACECTSVRPGVYATEINIHNFHDDEVVVEKYVIPVVLAGAAVAREPRVRGRMVADRLVLPPHSASMDDCCRIGELVFGATPPSPAPLTVGFLEIVSSRELAVTAVYTASDRERGSISIDVRQVMAANARAER